MLPFLFCFLPKGFIRQRRHSMPLFPCTLSVPSHSPQAPVSHPPAVSISSRPCPQPQVPPPPSSPGRLLSLVHRALHRHAARSPARRLKPCAYCSEQKALPGIHRPQEGKERKGEHDRSTTPEVPSVRRTPVRGAACARAPVPGGRSRAIHESSSRLPFSPPLSRALTQLRDFRG